MFFEPRDDAPPRSEWHRVLRGPLSVRIVAADLPSYATRAGVLPSVPDATNLADAILEHTEWSAALDAWAAFGNAVTAPLPAHVRCKRHTTAVWAPAGISPPLRRALALRLPEAPTPEPRRESGGRRNSGHAARGWRPGRASGAEAAHGPGPAVPGVSAPRELRRGASGANKAGRRGLGSLLRQSDLLGRGRALLAGGVGDRRRLGPGAT